jgi:hypothetical protein
LIDIVPREEIQKQNSAQQDVTVPQTQIVNNMNGKSITLQQPQPTANDGVSSDFSFRHHKKFERIPCVRGVAVAKKTIFPIML